LAAPLRVQRAISRLWGKGFASEDEAFRSPAFWQLAHECHTAYGAPARFSEQPDDADDVTGEPGCLQWHKSKLRTAFRNLGAPWYGAAIPDASTVSEKIHFGYEGGVCTRVYLVPLDRAPKNLPRTDFGPCRIGRFSEAELADLVNAAALRRHQRHPFDLGKFSQFSWLVVQETVQLEPAAKRDWITRLLEEPSIGFGLVDVYRRRFPTVVERALMTLLLHPWEDCARCASFDTWKPFDLPWYYPVNSDPFEVPRVVPDFASLSWEPYLTPNGDVIEHDQPARRDFEKIVFDDFEAKCRHAWTSLQTVCPLDQTSSCAFNRLIEHFLLRAYWEDGIDELVMQMTAVDAAIGKQEQGSTKAIARRLRKLLDDEDAKAEFEKLYNLRCGYIHGRGEKSAIRASDLVAARRLARRAAESVLSYAKDNPSATRCQMLDELEGAKP
jgi:hypothetical protein